MGRGGMGGGGIYHTSAFLQHFTTNDELMFDYYTNSSSLITIILYSPGDCDHVMKRISSAIYIPQIALPSAAQRCQGPNAAKAQALPRPKRCPAAIPSAAQQSRSAALGSATYYPAYRTQRLSKTRARESSAQTQRCREIRNAQRCREIRNAQRCL